MLTGLAPIESSDASVVILGSMPGAVSLERGEYYAHDRNAFWHIMFELLELPEEASYEHRCDTLRSHGIALWDVLANCRRKGSLDSAIKNPTPNDFGTFFAKHSSLTHVFFNGKKAEALFRRFVRNVPKDLELATLPSTSPAHTISRRTKTESWRSVVKAIHSCR